MVRKESVTNMIQSNGFYRLGALLLALVLVLSSLAGCNTEKQQEDIVILYTNDVHCAVDADIGYTGLAASLHLEAYIIRSWQQTAGT